MNNSFCLRFHNPVAVAGLHVDALRLDSRLTQFMDKRRQPMQPNRLIFGNVPGNYIGNPAPIQTTNYGVSVDAAMNPN